MCAEVKVLRKSFSKTVPRSSESRGEMIFDVQYPKEAIFMKRKPVSSARMLNRLFKKWGAKSEGHLLLFEAKYFFRPNPKEDIFMKRSYFYLYTILLFKRRGIAEMIFWVSILLDHKEDLPRSGNQCLILGILFHSSKKWKRGGGENDFEPFLVRGRGGPVSVLWWVREPFTILPVLIIL